MEGTQMRHLSARDAAMVLAATWPGEPPPLTKREITKAQRYIRTQRHRLTRRATHARSVRQIETLTA